MDERERLRHAGDDPLHEDALDDPTIVDRIPDAGAGFDDPLTRADTDYPHDEGTPADRLPLGTAARPGYGGAWVDPIAGETGTDPGTEPGTMAGATYDDRLGGETPAMPPADTQDDEAMAPEAAGGAIGGFGGMIAGAVVAGPPGAVVGGIVGAVSGAIVGGAAGGEPDVATDPDDPVTPVDDPSDPRLR